MGTGKSTVAQELARRWDMEYLSSDVTRKALAGVGVREHRYVPMGKGIYSSDYSKRTYDAILEKAEEHLKAGRSVVMDASFRRSGERARAMAVAQRLSVDLWIIECVLPENGVKARLGTRLKEGVSVSDGRWELFHQQQCEWEPVQEAPDNRYVQLDTSGSRQQTIEKLLQQLYSKALHQDTGRFLTATSPVR